MTLQRMALLGAVASELASDTDAAAYIAAVEAADGQALETGVRQAMDALFIGCKSDASLIPGVSNFQAINASCLLCGPRTQLGARVPLIATMPTPTENGTAGGWVYDRKLGLRGNGTNNFLNSGRNNNADIDTNHSVGVYHRRISTAGAMLFGARAAGSDVGAKYVLSPSTGNSLIASCNSVNAFDSFTASMPVGTTCLTGIARTSTASYTFRHVGASNTITRTSTTAASNNIYIFGTNNGGTLQLPYSGAIYFYWIGQAVDMSLLETRIANYVSAIAAAIP